MLVSCSVANFKKSLKASDLNAIQGSNVGEDDRQTADDLSDHIVGPHILISTENI